MARRKVTSTKRKSSIKRKPVLKRKSRFLLPWPYIFLILLSVGVLLAGWTFQAGAANINVTARIPAPLPTSPAIITSPADGDRFDEVPITVSGTCPLDSYVSIYTNNFFRGSVVCAVGGTFEIEVDLFPGANTLQAKVFNVTDDEGPQSAPITVHYDVPIPPPPPPPPPTPPPPPPPPASGGQEPSRNSGSSGGSKPGSGSVAASPFLIKSNFKYRGYLVGQIVEWKLEISGGSAPYAISIDWGDGTSGLLIRDKAGVFTISHQYEKQGNGNKNSFNIKVTGSDSKDRKSYLQFFVIINPSALGGVVASTLPTKPFSNNWLLLAWPAYAVVVLMFTTFWLGEKEELIKLRKQGLLRRRSA